MDFNTFFSKVASNYDKLINTLSIGLDKSMLSEAIKEAYIGKKRAKVLDVATGTGRVAFAIAKRYRNYNIIGVDINTEMLNEAAKRSKKLGNLNYILGDVNSLDFQSDTFDIVVSAFSLSVFSDLSRALSEMHRVLKRGGKIILLDMLKPKDSALKKLLDLYYSMSIMPTLDAKLKHDVEVYIKKGFAIDKAYILELLKEAGFKKIKEKEFSGGLAFIITAAK